MLNGFFYAIMTPKETASQDVGSLRLICEISKLVALLE